MCVNMYAIYMLVLITQNNVDISKISLHPGNRHYTYAYQSDTPSCWQNVLIFSDHMCCLKYKLPFFSALIQTLPTYSARHQLFHKI